MAKKKKSNNPLKVWGSWIGSIIFLIPFYNVILSGGCQNSGSPNVISISCTGIYVIMSIFAIVGFFIGYGIHLLIRKFRRKK